VSKRPSFKEFKEYALQNAEFKSEYEALRPEFELIRQFIKAILLRIDDSDQKFS